MCRHPCCQPARPRCAVDGCFSENLTHFFHQTIGKTKAIYRVCAFHAGYIEAACGR